MRQLMIRVPREYGAEVMTAAQAQNGTNLTRFEGASEDGAVDLVLVHVSNENVDPLLETLEELPDLHISLLPSSVIALRPPASDAPEQVIEVSRLSPIEIFLSGLQSVGSWKGYLGYATAAGFIVWIALFTNTIYLLTAAMLIAPFAGPAMNTALATARGDARLFRQAIGRYVAGITVTIGVSFIMSLIMRQEIATSQMVEASYISSVAFLLPLVAGAAGALNLTQSKSSSLVSGAATGMLVAASLAPPAGLIGMAAALGEWSMVKTGIFVLALQIIGINISGAIVFVVSGLRPRGVRYTRGKRRFGILAWIASVFLLIGLLGWQFKSPPTLQHSTLSKRAAATVQQILDNSDIAKLVETKARFTRANIQGQNSLLVEVFVQKNANLPAPDIQSRLTQEIQTELSDEFNLTALVDVTVLTAPDTRQD